MLRQIVAEQPHNVATIVNADTVVEVDTAYNRRHCHTRAAINVAAHQPPTLVMSSSPVHATAAMPMFGHHVMANAVRHNL